MTVTIRPATIADLDAMREAKALAGRAAWPHILPEAVIAQLPFPERWAAAVREPSPRSAALVAEIRSGVVGFALTRPSHDDDASEETGELDAFYTLPSAWGLGAGRALLAAATAELAGAGFAVATLWTAEQNFRPRRIYATAGWTPDGAARARELGAVAFTELRLRRSLDARACGESSA